MATRKTNTAASAGERSSAPSASVRDRAQAAREAVAQRVEADPQHQKSSKTPLAKAADAIEASWAEYLALDGGANEQSLRAWNWDRIEAIQEAMSFMRAATVQDVLIHIILTHDELDSAANATSEERKSSALAAANRMLYSMRAAIVGMLGDQQIPEICERYMSPHNDRLAALSEKVA